MKSYKIVGVWSEFDGVNCRHFRVFVRDSDIEFDVWRFWSLTIVKKESNG